MKKITTILTTAFSANTGKWNRNPGMLSQLFTGLTGYEIMFEESRQDIAVGNNTGNTPGQILSSRLSGPIKKCIVLLERESCNNYK